MRNQVTEVAYRNLMAQRSLIPSSEHQLALGSSSYKRIVFIFVTGVFAIENAANLNVQEIWAMWQNRPTDRRVGFDDGKSSFEPF